MKNSIELETICPICHNHKNNRLGEHIRKEHDDKAFQQAVLEAKKSGMSDAQIGEVFGITFRQLEKIITDAYGVNISSLGKHKKIKYWAPKNFRIENTTVWSYRQRGDWATHDGRYRGNWSPYIPRNVILRYSQPTDVVLDYFIGGGTTAVEAKLLGRKCIAKDINPACVALTKENLNFNVLKTLMEDNSIFEPEVYAGDARELSEIEDNTIDLICAHPPYAGIISYSSKVEGDLSMLSIDGFLREMGKVAQESYRVLKPGKKCAILIGDTRKQKHVVPIGFQTINVFMDAGFKLKELVIKRQHNCKTTSFWSEKSIKYNFLLLAHEYLPIFEKPNEDVKKPVSNNSSSGIIAKPMEPIISKDYELEATSVWIFPPDEYSTHLDSNVIRRYSKGNNYQVLSLEGGNMQVKHPLPTKVKDLLFIKSPLLNNHPEKDVINSYLELLRETVNANLETVTHGGYIVIQTQDVRINGYVKPLAQQIVKGLNSSNKLWLKEIVVVTPDKICSEGVEWNNEELMITHQYLLVYKVFND